MNIIALVLILTTNYITPVQTAPTVEIEPVAIMQVADAAGVLS